MTIASTTSGVTDGSTTNDSSVTLAFTSSEVTTNFVADDITVGGGAISDFTGSGTTHSYITPTTDGATTIDVAANKFTDLLVTTTQQQHSLTGHTMVQHQL